MNSGRIAEVKMISSTARVVAARLARRRPGVPVVVKHQNGTKTTVQATLGTYPGS
jgi:hypothetical protein